ncbi:MAG: LytR family transcriptional regulator [Clostridiaceae bacterium]|nr:LytR family transcriptional regulator [Clostridiaceae bacterium]
MQKKTKIALIILCSTIIVLSGVLILIIRPSGNEPTETVSTDEPIDDITPTPEPPVISEPDEETVQDPEPVGLTNGQRYYKDLVAEGSRNILLIGQDAVYHAYDTIIVVSLDEKNKEIKLINFPRDAYIDYNDKILNQLKEADPEKAKDNSIQKMNAAHAIAISILYKYETGGKFGKVTYMNFWADLLEEIFGITIDDYIIIRTEGFREIVDAFGGVYVDVPIYMHYEDPFQNLYIHLEPGYQLLNGEQAEGFVRFRQGYTPEGEFKTYSVYFRQKNQNAFLKAFYEQHVNLKNLGKLNDIVEIVKKNVRTSVNEWSEIVEYSKLAQKVLTGNYKYSATIVECEENPRLINGISYEILKTK